jgi:protein-disulfide isomerase
LARARRLACAFAPALAAVLAATLALGAAAGARAAGEDLSQDMSQGSAKAPVTVIEYASPTCPHCAHFEADVFPTFKAKYIDTGKVRYVLREAPIHPDLDAAAFLLARCAGPAGYFQVIDGVMKGQDEYFSAFLMQSANADQEIADAYRAVLHRVGKSVGLDDQHLSACLTDEASIKAMQARTDREMAQYHVDSTPTFVINGVKLTPPGAPDLATLEAAIAPALGQPARHAKRR